MTTQYRRDPELAQRIAVAERIKALTGRLPPSVERALANRAKVARAREAWTPTDTAAMEAAIRQEIATGKVPDDLPERYAIIAAHEAANAIAVRVWAGATEDAERTVSASIGAAAHDLLALLRHTLDDTLAETREAGSLIAGQDTADPLSLPPVHLDALRRVRAAADRHQAVREVHAQLGRATFGVYPDDGIGFGWMANAGDVWGSSIEGRHTNPGAKPWPVDPVGHVMWLAGHGRYIAARPEPWLPLPSEAEDAFRRFAESRTMTPVGR
jgi:hypothetical protein